MKCIIPGTNVKVFGRAIHSLSKLGEELYIEALEHGLALRTVNSSRSAYACFIFAPTFFLHYSDGVGDGDSAASDEEVLKYKINMKSCLTVFKSLSNLEKTVDKCQIKLDLKESRLVFQMYCRHGIVKTHNLAFIECETLQAVFAKDTSKNVLTAQTKLLCEAVLNFQTTQEEVSLIVDTTKTRLKNYVEDESDPNKVVHTELSLDPDEFESYAVGEDTQVTFCLKELRAILAFSEPANLPVSIYFETAGKPIVFSMETDPSFEANFVLATLADKGVSVSCSQTSSQQRPTQRINNTTMSDHRANKTPNKRVEERRSSTENLRDKRPAANGEATNTTKLKNNNSVFKKPSASSRLNAACKELCDDVTPGSDVTSDDVTKSSNHHSKARLTSDVTNGRVDTNKRETDVPRRSNDVTMREDDVRPGVDDVTRLGGDVTRPGGDVMRPGGDVTRLGGDVTRPGGDVMRPSGDVTRLGGDVTRPGGDITRLGGDVTRPGGDITRPIGDVTRLGGDVTGPGGDVTRLGGDVTKPGGDSTLGPPEKPRPSLLRFGEDSEDDDDDDDDMPCSPIIPVQTSRLKDASFSMSRLVPDDDSTTDDEPDKDLVPGTPPSKKFKSMFFGLSQSTTAGSQAHQRTVLAEDTDDDDD